jgi:hypothetical protein
MVVEHIFVTTAPRDQAMSSVAAFLGVAGFHGTASGPDGGGRAESPDSIAVVRGDDGGIDPLNCLQEVRLQYDRGRINVAISMNPRQKFKKRSILVRPIDSRVDPNSPPGQYYTGMMRRLAEMVEDVALLKQKPDEAAIKWHHIMQGAWRTVTPAAPEGISLDYIWLAVGASFWGSSC